MTWLLLPPLPSQTDRKAHCCAHVCVCCTAALCTSPRPACSDPQPAAYARRSGRRSWRGY
jgi:hypothetical protein